MSKRSTTDNTPGKGGQSRGSSTTKTTKKNKNKKGSNVFAILNNRGEVESVAVLDPKVAGQLTFVGEEGRVARPVDSKDRAVTDPKILRGEKGEKARDDAFATITKIVQRDNLTD
ncbi:MAG: hypothetical protein ACF8PN_04820 [Phycisphaerales bacterium]